jgi:hypothetical protein
MNTKLMHPHPPTSRILPLGKSMIQLELDQPDAEEFINGYQTGHLAYMVHWRGVPVMDTGVVLMCIMRSTAPESSPVFSCGVLIGRLSTLIRYGGSLLPTGPSFARGYHEGLAAACQYHQRVLLLTELCTLLHEQHGADSAQQAGYRYGLIEGLTKGLRTVPLRIPGEGAEGRRG